MKKLSLALLSLLMVGMMLLAVGCGGKDNTAKPDNQPTSEQKQEQELKQIEATLYFSDDQAMYLMPEERTLKVANNDPAVVGKAVVEALIAGPQTKGLNRTMPDGTEVLGVEVLDSVANVNLNKAFKENHWGGSEGEIHTLYSIVNTLAKNIGVTEVQFTIEGQIDDSILGHVETTEPLVPDFDLIKE